jgi:stage III sporulation protein AH
MINKKNLWFLTLFSLILVLSVYYITMPSELMLTNNSSYLKEDKTKVEKTSVEVEESEVLTAMRVTSDEKLDKELDTLKGVLSNSKSTVDEKNQAYEKIKSLNENKTKEKDIENKIEQLHKLKSFVKIEDNNVKVTINSDKHDTELANKIMRTVNEILNNDMTVTIEFKK